MEDIMGQSIVDVRVDPFRDKWFITGMIPPIHNRTMRKQVSINDIVQLFVNAQIASL